MRMGQRKCVCAIKCGRTVSKQSRRQKQQQHSGRHAMDQQQNNHVEEILNSHNPIVEMITTRARLCNHNSNNNEAPQKNEKIIAIVDSTMHDCKPFKGSNGNCTATNGNHHRGPHQGHRHHRAQQLQNALDGSSSARRKHKIGHGMNSTLEDRIRLKFFGHDIPYPPVDFAVRDHFGLIGFAFCKHKKNTFSKI